MVTSTQNPSSTLLETLTPGTGLSTSGIEAIAGSIGAVITIAIVSTALFVCYRVRERTRASFRAQQSGFRETDENNERDIRLPLSEVLPSLQYPRTDENEIDSGRLAGNR